MAGKLPIVPKVECHPTGFGKRPREPVEGPPMKALKRQAMADAIEEANVLRKEAESTLGTTIRAAASQYAMSVDLISLRLMDKTNSELKDLSDRDKDRLIYEREAELDAKALECKDAAGLARIFDKVKFSVVGSDENNYHHIVRGGNDNEV